MPAERLGLRDRGVVREGAMADLVTFDPVAVADAATYTDPARYPVGIVDVIVNGRPAVLGGAETGRATRPPAAAGLTPWRSSGAGATETLERVRLPGGPLDYTLRRSPRARTLRVLIHPQRGVVVTIPASARRGWGAPERHVESFLGEREPWLRRHLARQARDREDLAARGGLRDGATLRYRGDLHRLRIEPARPGARRSSVERVGGIEEDEIVVRLAAGGPALDGGPARSLVQAAGPGRDRSRDRQPRRRAMRVTPGLGRRPRPADALGERLAPRPAVVLVAPDPRPAGSPRDGRHPRAGAPAGVRARAGVLGARRVAPAGSRARGGRWLHDHSHELHGALDPTGGQD